MSVLSAEVLLRPSPSLLSLLLACCGLALGQDTLDLLRSTLWVCGGLAPVSSITPQSRLFKRHKHYPLLIFRYLSSMPTTARSKKPERKGIKVPPYFILPPNPKLNPTQTAKSPKWPGTENIVPKFCLIRIFGPLSHERITEVGFYRPHCSVIRKRRHWPSNENPHSHKNKRLLYPILSLGGMNT